jgi:hypothetical protein
MLLRRLDKYEEPRFLGVGSLYLAVPTLTMKAKRPRELLPQAISYFFDVHFHRPKAPQNTQICVNRSNEI